jgi:hypothetical protein
MTIESSDIDHIPRRRARPAHESRHRASAARDERPERAFLKKNHFDEKKKNRTPLDASSSRRRRVLSPLCACAPV